MTALPEQYRNQVVHDDVMTVLRDLPDGCVDMIYGDPDYNVDIKYDGHNFTSSWDEYIGWYIDLARESLRVLRPDGNLFFINYPKQNAYLRVKYLDENAYAVHDYAWVYNTNVGHSPRRLTTAHRSILHATKDKHNRFYKDQIAHPYQNPTDPRIRERISQGHKGRMPYSWLYFNLVKNVSRQKADHPCQIPEGLSELLIKSCTVPGDSVFVLFGGSGSEVVQARNLDRVYLTCELQRRYCEIIESRLRNNGVIADEHRHPAQLKQRNGTDTPYALPHVQQTQLLREIRYYREPM